MKRCAWLCLLGLLGSACGGGGDSDSPAQGIYIGTTSTGRATTGLIFSDGSFYVLYTRAGIPTEIGGAIQGTSIASGGTWSSSDARDYNFEGSGVTEATLSGTYQPRRTSSGAVSYPSGNTVSFTGVYAPIFEQTPSITTVAGSYSGSVTNFSGGFQSVTASVSASGEITADAEECRATGSTTPRTDGNAYDVRLTFGPAPCRFPGESFRGIAYYEAASRRLVAAAHNGSRTQGVLMVGVKE